MDKIAEVIAKKNICEGYGLSNRDSDSTKIAFAASVLQTCRKFATTVCSRPNMLVRV